MIDPYTPDTIEGVRNVLRGLSQRMKVEHTVRYTELSPTRFKDFWRE